MAGTSFRPLSIAFILGGPGVGKGTQCEKAAKEFGSAAGIDRVNGEARPQLLHLSAGELLRREMANPTSATGAVISKCIEDGVIVPAEITVELLRAQIVQFARSSREHGMVLVDGFPRNFDNLDCWNRAAAIAAAPPAAGTPAGTTEVQVCIPMVKHIVYFEGSEEVLLARLKKRSVTSGRTDDNSASIVKRFATFRRDTLPVVKLPEHKVHVVPADGSVEDIYIIFRAALLDIYRLACTDI